MKLKPVIQELCSFRKRITETLDTLSKSVFFSNPTETFIKLTCKMCLYLQENPLEDDEHLLEAWGLGSKDFDLEEFEV